MRVKQEFPPRVLLAARRYVEEKKIPFFDFFRNCAFGFVFTGEAKGYFAMLVRQANDQLESICNCSSPKENQVCSHGLALHLRLMNWPNKRQNLSTQFDAFPPRMFLQNMAANIKSAALQENLNPRLSLPETTVPQRLLDYLGFGSSEETAMIKRDRQCLATAKNRARSENERVMLERNMPSSRLAFEESLLFNLSKLLFYLDQLAPFRYRAQLLPDHQVQVSFSQGDQEVFTWSMGVATFLKATKDHWRFWEPTLDFEVRQQGVSLQYRIVFSEGNALEIEAVVPTGDGEFVSQNSVKIPGPGNLCYHESLGYFHIQTGLSLFEMTYSEPGIHRVNPDNVKQFLKTHQDTLENLDRNLMDSGLFDQVVTQYFQSFEISLLDFVDECFQFELRAGLGGLSFDWQGLKALFEKPARYVKAGGKLFDTVGYDAVYLKPLLNPETESGQGLSIAELFQFISLFRDRLTVKTNQLTESVYDMMRGLSLPEPPLLEHTGLTLRPYQQLGYQWLHFLKSFSLGGLLCDQMGLGKTHQGMALIAATLLESSQARILVLAPTSVLFHWRQKLKAFCPGIRLLMHHGTQRASLTGISSGQVVLTSYGTARNDAVELGETHWDLIVFDEVQILKNKGTKAYQAISNIPAKTRIGLTGTPIENHMGELKSLFDLVMPNYLGGDTHFKRHFLDPIQKGRNQSTRDRLTKMISPFILRRAKAQVLTELPEKVEDLRDFELDEYERELYEKVRTEGRAELDEATQAGPPRVMHIFQIINKLKQVCNHPALYFGNRDYRTYPSTKWSMFTELVEETMASEEKLVVFTQYLGMVDMICSYLNHQAIGYACVTGSTTNREGEQGRFQNDPACRVFVGTLQAAGVGIDLTAGSVLIHYDRWWNPAREEQATDRIHRIGQKNNVQIYKFRGLNSVEARIDLIIERKRMLLDNLVAFDDDQVGKSFTVDELLDILS